MSSPIACRNLSTGLEWAIPDRFGTKTNSDRNHIYHLYTIKIEKEYQEAIKNLSAEDKAKAETKENDIIVDGNSVRQFVINKHGVKYRIVEYIKFLIPEVEGALDNIEYADIEAEWPLAVQMQVYEAINDAIQPGYKESRKN